jgi:hypothetical protein
MLHLTYLQHLVNESPGLLTNVRGGGGGGGGVGQQQWLCRSGYGNR